MITVKINKTITNKIREGSFRKNIKEFLRDILYFELVHSEEARPRYKEDYEEIINKYTNPSMRKR